MKLASSQTDAEARAGRIADDIRWRSRELFANMLRVSRGGGRPTMLGQQITELAVRIIEYRQNGAGPVVDGVLDNALFLEPIKRDLIPAVDDLVRGSMQVVASLMLGQMTQLAAGENQIHKANDEVFRVNKAREAELANWQAPVKPRHRRRPVL